MDVRDMATIRKNLRFLIESMDCNSIRFYLFEKNILTQDDMELLAMPDKTRSYKNEVLLLHILPRRGPSAYPKFVESLREDGHFSHVVDVLERTVLSESDLQGRIQTERYQAIHQEVDQMYERIQRRRTSRDPTRIQPSNGAASHFQRSHSNQSGFDEPDASMEPNLPADTFEVQLETTEASERCGFELGRYLINLSMNGVAVIKFSDFISNQIGNCPKKALWEYNVIRQYGSSPDRFAIEVGRRACTGEGMFYFNTRCSEDGSSIGLTIKRYTGLIRQNGQNQ